MSILGKHCRTVSIKETLNENNENDYSVRLFQLQGEFNYYLFAAAIRMPIDVDQVYKYWTKNLDDPEYPFVIPQDMKTFSGWGNVLNDFLTRAHNRNKTIFNKSKDDNIINLFQAILKRDVNKRMISMESMKCAFEHSSFLIPHLIEISPEICFFPINLDWDDNRPDIDHPITWAIRHKSEESLLLICQLWSLPKYLKIRKIYGHFISNRALIYACLCKNVMAINIIINYFGDLLQPQEICFQSCERVLVRQEASQKTEWKIIYSPEDDNSATKETMKFRGDQIQEILIKFLEFAKMRMKYYFLYDLQYPDVIYTLLFSYLT